MFRYCKASATDSKVFVFQDQFKYSYPPLPDDDFQSPICENGPIVSEDESEIKDTESECKDSLELSFNTELTLKNKKVPCSVKVSTYFKTIII